MLSYVAPSVVSRSLTCVCVSGVFSGADGSQLAEFLRAAALLRGQFRLAHAADLKLGEKHGVTSE